MSEKTVYLPNVFDNKSISELMNQVFDDGTNYEYEKINFDFTTLNFIRPGGVTVMANLVSWLLKRKKKVVFVRHDIENASHRNRESMIYLEDCGFFNVFGLDNTYSRGELRSTTTPLKKLEYSQFDQWLKTEFKYWLQKQTNKKVEFSNINVAIQEIFNNIKDHSTESIGCVFAQFYPKRNQICISLSDFGVGIPTSLRTKFPEIKNDSDLLEKAVEHGVSTRSTPQNRGVGLWNIMKSLTQSSIGTVYIVSNYGTISYSNEVVIDKDDSKVFYPGTFFEIWINTDNPSLYDDEEEEEFSWFM